MKKSVAIQCPDSGEPVGIVAEFQSNGIVKLAVYCEDPATASDETETWIALIESARVHASVAAARNFLLSAGVESSDVRDLLN